MFELSPSRAAQARITAEVDDTWSEKRYQFQRDDTWSKGQVVDSALDFEADDALLALRSSWRPDGQSAWTHCTFTLEPDGTFRFDVGRAPMP